VEGGGAIDSGKRLGTYGNPRRSARLGGLWSKETVRSGHRLKRGGFARKGTRKGMRNRTCSKKTQASTWHCPSGAASCQHPRRNPKRKEPPTVGGPGWPKKKKKDTKVLRRVTQDGITGDRVRNYYRLGVGRGETGTARKIQRRTL